MKKCPFKRSPQYRSRREGGGGRLFVSFTTSKFSRVQSTSSSQSSQGYQPTGKSNRPFRRSFFNKKVNPSQHNLTSTKNTFSGDFTNASVKTCASFGTKPFPKGEIEKFPLAGRLQYFLEKLENSEKLTNLKTIRMGIWVKNRLPGGK